MVVGGRVEEDLGIVTQLGVFVREGQQGAVVAEERRRRIVTCEYCYRFD